MEVSSIGIAFMARLFLFLTVFTLSKANIEYFNSSPAPGFWSFAVRDGNNIVVSLVNTN